MVDTGKIITTEKIKLLMKNNAGFSREISMLLHCYQFGIFDSATLKKNFQEAQSGKEIHAKYPSTMGDVIFHTNADRTETTISI